VSLAVRRTDTIQLRPLQVARAVVEADPVVTAKSGIAPDARVIGLFPGGSRVPRSRDAPAARTIGGEPVALHVLSMASTSLSGEERT
jgi:hypothetical protein